MSLYYMHIFIKQRCIKLIKNDSKDIYNVIKDFYGFCKNMKQHNCFYFKIVFHSITVFTVFLIKYAALVSLRDLFRKH